ncbi:MAG: SulP family inorganic anion transporter [Acidimicrobiia bacterium]|nr:SulP family inorganic anion transporter [Acidimicrobiia bacterium]
MGRAIPILAWGPATEGAPARRRHRGAHGRGHAHPQGMAYASLAGMPPVTGLYAAIVGIVAYAVLGTSGSLAVGPVAITSLLTLEGLSRVTSPEDPSYTAIAALLALMVGAVLLVLGLLRLGVLVNLLSHPVISGFTSAAAIVIALSQVKDLLGVDVGRPEGVVGTVRALVDDLGAADPATMVLAALALLALALGRRYARRFPMPLLVVLAATVATWAMSLDDRGVAILREVPGGLPAPALPELSGSLFGDLAPVALTIAVVAFAEGVSVAKAIARKTREKVDANQELVATGAANLAAGTFGAFRVAGALRCQPPGRSPDPARQPRHRGDARRGRPVVHAPVLLSAPSGAGRDRRRRRARPGRRGRCPGDLPAPTRRRGDPGGHVP